MLLVSGNQVVVEIFRFVKLFSFISLDSDLGILIMAGDFTMFILHPSKSWKSTRIAQSFSQVSFFYGTPKPHHNFIKAELKAQ
jgi:hypothetical protein